MATLSTGEAEVCLYASAHLKVWSAAAALVPSPSAADTFAADGDTTGTVSSSSAASRGTSARLLGLRPIWER
jgi:hypothetical protein